MAQVQLYNRQQEREYCRRLDHFRRANTETGYRRYLRRYQPRAAIALVNTANGVDDNATNSVSSGAFSATATNLIVVFVKWEVSGVTLSSITDTALNTYTLKTNLDYNAGANHIRCGYAFNIAGNGANVVKANFSDANGLFKHLAVLQYSGALTTDPFDVEDATVTGSSTSGTSASKTTTAIDVILCAVGGNTSLTFTAGNIFGSASALEFGTGGVGADLDVEDRLNVAAGTGTAAMTWTPTSAFGLLLESFKAAAAAGVAPSTTMSLMGVG